MGSFCTNSVSPFSPHNFSSTHYSPYQIHQLLYIIARLDVINSKVPTSKVRGKAFHHVTPTKRITASKFHLEVKRKKIQKLRKKVVQPQVVYKTAILALDTKGTSIKTSNGLPKATCATSLQNPIVIATRPSIGDSESQFQYICKPSFSIVEDGVNNDHLMEGNDDAEFDRADTSSIAKTIAGGTKVVKMKQAAHTEWEPCCETSVTLEHSGNSAQVLHLIDCVGDSSNLEACLWLALRTRRTSKGAILIEYRDHG